jgi:hypothetical protein
MGSAIALLAALLAAPASGLEVSIRATTAAVTVTGGDAAVSATLYDPEGRVIDGLVVERGGSRTTIVLVDSVKPGARIEVRVPIRVNLRVEASNGGPVTVRGVQGQLEIVNSNAPIVLDAVGGTVVASTSNGAITAALSRVDPALPLSFLTSNEPIDVQLPAALAATLCLESDHPSITSDFPLAPAGGEPVERRILRGGRLRTIRCGLTGGGGPRIELRTENAPIRVRKGP